MSKHTRLRRHVARCGAVLAAAAVLACTPRSSGPPAPVDVRGTDPNAQGGTVTAPAPQDGPVQGPASGTADGNGVITYDGYQSVVARQGDTVATIAARVGLSAAQLGAYNGLGADAPLLAGDELVLPPRPGGYASGVGAAPTASPATAATAPRQSTIEQTTLDGTGTAATEAPAPTAPQTGGEAGWSPELAAQAIARSAGTTADGRLGAPPSAGDPLPPEPAEARDLRSPELDQYRTSDGENALPPVPAPGRPIAGDTGLARAPSTGPAATGINIRMQRPVEGPIALGFNKGAGAARNDGVDFAAPAGAPVVAAADGEVALVSQSLGGLGTIVLVRHADELLTVYGRIDGVSVVKGDIVSRGQQIGVVAAVAAPAEPRMHFEVRRGSESLNPEQFL